MQRISRSLVGHSPAIEAVMNSASLIAATDVTVIILGESGTGKELLAEAIHTASKRAEEPFVSINCAALPESLAESELFGHRKGSFTGADKDYTGRIPAADGGTLFLDEIGELSLGMQAKLLRFLESGECQAIGQTAPRRVDVRVVAATNRDLQAQVRAGTFRADLFYRLNVVPLMMPPLRERSEDVPILINHLTESLARQYNLTPPRYSKQAVKALSRYRWPGNVRELRNLCERMLVLLPGSLVDVENLPSDIVKREGGDAHETWLSLPAAGCSLEALERSLIGQALARTGGNRTRAAQLLGLSRDTLLYRMKKYAIA